MRAALRELPAPRPRPGFAAEALRAARRTDRAYARKSLRHDGMLAFAGAMAASLCFAVLLWLRPPTADSAGTLAAAATQTPRPASSTTLAGLEIVSLTIGRVESMRLRIESPRDVADVRFSVDLPDRVSLAGQPGIRAMTWQGTLRKGDNVLELPLVAEAGASGRMQARVSWGSFEQRIEANVIGVPAPQAGSAAPTSNGI